MFVRRVYGVGPYTAEWPKRMTGDKIYRYLIAVPSGLEEVALDELRETVPQVQGINVEPGGRYGQIFFTFRRSPMQLLGLHSALQLSGVVCEMQRVTVGRPGLDAISSRVARIDFAAVASLARSQPVEIDTSAFTLSATLQGRYRFSNSEVVRAVRAVLCEQHGLREGRGNRLLRLHLQLTGHRALLLLRLGEGISGGRAVAFCLARLLALKSDARVLWTRRDPTELFALRELFQPHMLLGLLPEQMRKTKVQNGLLALRAKLPLRAGIIDYVFAFAGADPIGELAELARILRFGGVALIQVEHLERFMGILEEMDYPFVVLAVLALQEQGRKYRLLIIERLEEVDPNLLQLGWES